VKVRVKVTVALVYSHIDIYLLLCEGVPAKYTVEYKLNDISGRSVIQKAIWSIVQM
jgi:hypothetical protein